MMMLEARGRLRAYGVGAARPTPDGREVVVHARPAARPGAAETVHEVRIAQLLEPPHQHVEEVHGLFQDPRTDASAFIAPAPGALAVGKAKEADVGVERLADLAVAHQAADQAPLGR